MLFPTTQIVRIYTDGSCHTQLKIGAWAAILFINNEKLTLTGTATNTTHNRMELTAVIEALQYIQTVVAEAEVILISDSQYVVGLEARKAKLSALGFTTKKGDSIRNADLVQALLAYTKTITIRFEKIKAHQQKTGSANYNIEADKLCRKMVREAVAATT